MGSGYLQPVDYVFDDVGVSMWSCFQAGSPAPANFTTPQSRPSDSPTQVGSMPCSSSPSQSRRKHPSESSGVFMELLD